MDKALFDSKRIASGYANDRPWLHKSVIEQIQADFIVVHICQAQYADPEFAFYAAKAEETEIPQTPYDIVTADGVVEDIPQIFSYAKQTVCQMQYEFDMSSFIRFMMTQTNINSKIESGHMTEEAVLSWMQETLSPIFQEQRQTLIFDGYIRIYIRGAED